MNSLIRRLRRRLTRRRAVPSVLTHEEALRLLVDYHFNRLPAEASTRVEEHIRSCAACQRAGLGHARTERHHALRQLTSVRPTRRRRLPRISRRALVITGLLCVCTATVLGVLTNRLPSTAQLLPGQGALDDQATPPMLTARTPLALRTTGAAAVAADPRDHTIAVAGAYGGTPTITLRGAADGQLAPTFAWPGKGVPSMLAWSPSGSALAASDGTVVVVWDVSVPALRWTADSPASTPAAIFAYENGAVASTPDLTTALATSAFLQWGEDGQLVPAPVAAAEPRGAALANGSLVGVWRASGTHFLFQGAEIVAGPGAEPAKTRRVVLDWSPDGHYLLYSAASQHVEMPDDPTPTTAQRGAPPPDAILVRILRHLSAARHGDGFAWFSGDGKRLAVCDRSASTAALHVYDLTSSRLIAALPGVCDDLTVSSVAWMSHSYVLLVALPGQPVRPYTAK
jgi:hypothetical protein